MWKQYFRPETFPFTHSEPKQDRTSWNQCTLEIYSILEMPNEIVLTPHFIKQLWMTGIQVPNNAKFTHSNTLGGSDKTKSHEPQIPDFKPDFQAYTAFWPLAYTAFQYGWSPRFKSQVQVPPPASLSVHTCVVVDVWVCVQHHCNSPFPSHKIHCITGWEKHAKNSSLAASVGKRCGVWNAELPSPLQPQMPCPGWRVPFGKQ